MNMIALVIVSLMTANAYALVGNCVGSSRGERIVIVLEGDQENGSGSVSVGGRLVARFDGPDLRVNLIMQSIRARNAHGDVVEARVTNLSRQTGVLSRLIVPAYGINFSQVPVQCNLR